MKKIILFAAIAGLTLVGAAPHYAPGAGGMKSASGGYPPCSRTVTDRCIQLYERGVSSAANLALNERLAVGSPARTAMGGPYEAAPFTSAGLPARTAKSGYPACSKTVTDRCIQLYERGVSGAGN